MPTTFLAGLASSSVAMIERPAYNLTIEELAKDAGLSRSVLAERFADLVGTLPCLFPALMTGGGSGR
ncbi:MAG: hypothetical protein Q8K85_00580 [Hyphomicrobium sp.]|nr:hypothetical protein [Hyphomicrobium sp.]